MKPKRPQRPKASKYVLKAHRVEVHRQAKAKAWAPKRRER